MKEWKDLTGQTFGRLTVLSLHGRVTYPSGPTVQRWLCTCLCGKQRVVIDQNLLHGHTISCGCAHRDAQTKHGMSESAEYKIWKGMLTRCNNPKDTAFSYYGGRGIRVCKRWHVFTNFLADVGPRPSARASIDRINSDRNYQPSNCRWASREQQARNKRQYSTNTSGVSGVTWKNDRRKWIAQVNIGDKNFYLGAFDDINDAAKARKDKEIELGFHRNHGSRK